MKKPSANFGNHRRQRKARVRTLESLESRNLLTAAGYVQMNLVSDQSGLALLQDPNLVNPWGVAVPTTSGDFAVADNGAAVSTFYNGSVAGSPFAKDTPVVQIPGGFPTADVVNGTSDFQVPGTGAPATYLYATQTGQIAAWSSSLSPANQAKVVASVPGADFTGLAIGSNNSHNYLYAADFQNGKIVVFDSSFTPTTLAGSFSATGVPSGYAPFNIQLINGQLYVTYAQQQAIGEEGGTGSGFNVPNMTGGGYVGIFNTDGTFVKTISDTHLVSPWGLAQVPASAAQYAGDILVGDFGDGRINVFDSSGAFVAQLTDTSGNPLSIGGLRGLAFGNGATAGDATALFFTAEPGATNAAPESPSVVLLDPSSQGALTAVGNGTVSVAGGGEIVVDSNNAAGVVAIGNGHIAASELDVSGSPGVSVVGNASVLGTIDSGVSPLADPLAGLASPPVPATTFSAVHVSGRENVTLQPGAYVGGIFVSGQAMVTLLPGLYYLQGGGLSITGQGRVVGNGVTIYNAPAGEEDAIRVVGLGSLQLTAPTTGTYAGIALFQDRTSSVPIHISGNGAVSITGTLYAAGAAVDLSGNGHLNMQGDVASAVGTQLVVDDLNVFGNGDFDMQSVPVVAGEHGLFGTLQLAGANPLVVTSGDLTATEGQSFNGAVASFASTTAGAVESNFSATINWGDGTSTTGTVTATGNGGFVVTGTHTFSEEGTESVTVTISDTASHTVTASDTLTVADAPLAGAGTHFLSAPGQTRHGVTVATFTDPGGAEATSNYTATIDWGDGSGSDSNTTITQSNGVFTVAGSHVYAHPGRYDVTVTVREDGGATTTIYSFAGNGHADDDDQFITDAFADILGRDVDPAGLAFFAAAMQNGLPSGKLADILTHSDEYYEKQIEQAYEDFLGRGADAGGLQFWLSNMRSGMTIEQLDAGFIGSPEFYAHSGGSNQSWVDEMYFDLLGRAPDAGGEAFWIDALKHGANRQLVALGFAASAEHETTIVENDYQTYLNRDASSAEVEGWVNAFQHGLNNEQVVAGFVGSPEYFSTQTADD